MTHTYIWLSLTLLTVLGLLFLLEGTSGKGDRFSFVVGFICLAMGGFGGYVAWHS